MKKRFKNMMWARCSLLLSACALAFAGCVTTDEGVPPPGDRVYGQPLTAVNGTGTVTIREGSRTVAVCTTASPNIEQTRFIEEQNRIVVKSRGDHGPATVELFDTATGALQGTVKAYELAEGGPAWAAGMGE